MIHCLQARRGTSYRPARQKHGTPFSIFWIGLAALLGAGSIVCCAVVLVFNPFPFTSVVSDPVSVPDSAIDPTPVRQPQLLPEYRAGVFTYRCSECHKIIDSPAETTRTLTQHTEIQLEHGINTRCFNCHHPTNRDAFVDDYGREIPWDQPPELCGKCHGPVYRDWQHGSHGRTNGYWDRTKGSRRGDGVSSVMIHIDRVSRRSRQLPVPRHCAWVRRTSSRLMQHTIRCG